MLLGRNGEREERGRRMTNEQILRILRGELIGTNEQFNEAIAVATKAIMENVEVVRCKDCAYSCPFTEEELKSPYRVGEWHCTFWYAEMHEDDYCSCGKRRKKNE